MIRSRLSTTMIAFGGIAVLALAGCGSGSTAASTTASAASTTSAAATTATGSAGATESGSAGSSTTESSGAPALSADCTPTAMKTFATGTLTVATSEPAYEPWIVADEPTNGKGYESAVAYAVAERLGYTKEQVSWVRVPFDAVITPTPKEFDFDINQVSINADRAQAVDFSTGYYDVTQAIVTVKGSPIAAVTALAGLKDAKLGAMLGTTSLDAINAVIAPTTKPAIFDDNALAVAALQNGTIDGLVLDLPSAFFAASAQLTDGAVLGQLPSTSGAVEQFGLVLDKGSALTSCVSAAVDSLRADGTLDKLVQQWISDAGAPQLS